MTYPYSGKTYPASPEVLIFEKTVANTTTASGVQTATVDLPPGSYDVGVSVYTTGAGAAAAGTVKVFAYQLPSQANTAVALSVGMQMIPHGSTTLATVLTAPASATAAGSSGHIALSSFAAEGVTVPYGLMVATACNTSTGTISYKIIAQRR